MDSLVVKDNISIISFLLRPQTVISFSNNHWVQIPIVSSRRTLVNNESTPKDAIYKSEFCSHVTLANSKESFRVCSLDVRSHNKGTKNLAHLYAPVLRADKIGLSFGILLTSGL